MHNMLATARHACGRHWGVSDGGMVSVMNNKLMHSTGEHTDSHTYTNNAVVRLVKKTVSDRNSNANIGDGRR